MHEGMSPVTIQTIKECLHLTPSPHCTEEIWKRIKCFSFTLSRRDVHVKMEQWPAILDLCPVFKMISVHIETKYGRFPIADLHVAVIWLQLPEFLSTFLSYLNFEVPGLNNNCSNNHNNQKEWTIVVVVVKWRHHANRLLTNLYHLLNARWCLK